MARFDNANVFGKFGNPALKPLAARQTAGPSGAGEDLIGDCSNWEQTAPTEVRIQNETVNENTVRGGIVGMAASSSPCIGKRPLLPRRGITETSWTQLVVFWSGRLTENLSADSIERQQRQPTLRET